MNIFATYCTCCSHNGPVYLFLLRGQIFIQAQIFLKITIHCFQVGDFGLSKIKRNTLVTGGVRGTLPWMAPELLFNFKGSEKVCFLIQFLLLWVKEEQMSGICSWFNKTIIDDWDIKKKERLKSLT